MSVPKCMRAGRTVALCAALLACADPSGPGSAAAPSPLFHVSGTIQNNTGSPIPENARLLLAWIVFAGPADFTYAFGEGQILPSGRFDIDLLEPPSTVFNAGAYGVGILVATTSPELTQGSDLNDFPIDDYIGATGEFAVVFVADPAAAATWSPWTADFEPGYGVGMGRRIPGAFDIFVPTSPDSVVLILDDIDNIEFMNWG